MTCGVVGWLVGWLKEGAGGWFLVGEGGVSAFRFCTCRRLRARSLAFVFLAPSFWRRLGHRGPFRVVQLGRACLVGTRARVVRVERGEEGVRGKRSKLPTKNRGGTAVRGARSTLRRRPTTRAHRASPGIEVSVASCASRGHKRGGLKGNRPVFDSQRPDPYLRLKAHAARVDALVELARAGVEDALGDGHFGGLVA